MPPLVALLPNNCKYKHDVYQSGVLDYVTYPLIEAEFNYRIKLALRFGSVPLENKIQLLDGQSIPIVTSSSFPYEHTSASNIGDSSHLAEKASQYLIQSLGEDIQLNDLAAKMGTNRNKITKAFNSYFGKSVIKWLREQRMAKAKALLLNTSIPISEVAYEVGYENPQNFSTVYRKIFSKSPRQERQSVTNSKDLVRKPKVDQ
jgi:AraC-like DNA-binding protein